MNIRKITAFIACDPRGVIGKNGTLPWDYPEELERFRRTTDEQIMVMGRKTFETIPEATAKDRFNIIFSKHYEQLVWLGRRTVYVSNLPDFLNFLPMVSPQKEIYMIGGAQIATLFFEAGLIQEILLTKIHQCYEGDTFFPLTILDSWAGEAVLHNKHFTVYRYLKPSLPL